MKKIMKNETGISLVELLAVLVIGSIILLLISNVHLFGQKQYKNQSLKAGHLYDVTYAAKVITKEIRKAEKVKWDGNTLTLTLNGAPPVLIQKQNNSILKNGSPFVSGIEKFQLILDNRKLKIIIESINQNGKKQKIETEIHAREGVIIE